MTTKAEWARTAPILSCVVHQIGVTHTRELSTCPGFAWLFLQNRACHIRKWISLNYAGLQHANLDFSDSKRRQKRASAWKRKTSLRLVTTLRFCRGCRTTLSIGYWLESIFAGSQILIYLICLQINWWHLIFLLIWYWFVNWFANWFGFDVLDIQINCWLQLFLASVLKQKSSRRKTPNNFWYQPWSWKRLPSCSLGKD